MSLELKQTTNPDEIRQLVGTVVRADKTIAKLNEEIAECRKIAGKASDTLNNLILGGLVIVIVQGHGKYAVGKENMTKPLRIERIDEL